MSIRARRAIAATLCGGKPTDRSSARLLARSKGKRSVVWAKRNKQSGLQGFEDQLSRRVRVELGPQLGRVAFHRSAGHARRLGNLCSALPKQRAVDESWLEAALQVLGPAARS